MQNEIKDGAYYTTDLYFAAYLQTAGAPLQKTARQGGGKVSFVFDCGIVNIEQLRTAWFNHTGKVPALPYANSIKNLKHLCHMP